MNSYSIKQREIKNEFHQEFFCHFDEKYIILCSKLDFSISWFCLAYITSHEESELEHKNASIELQVYLLNGEVIQTIKIPKFKWTYRPYFSQSGEFLVIPVEVNFSSVFLPIINRLWMKNLTLTWIFQSIMSKPPNIFN